MLYVCLILSLRRPVNEDDGSPTWINCTTSHGEMKLKYSHDNPNELMARLENKVERSLTSIYKCSGARLRYREVSKCSLKPFRLLDDFRMDQESNENLQETWKCWWGPGFVFCGFGWALLPSPDCLHLHYCNNCHPSILPFAPGVWRRKPQVMMARGPAYRYAGLTARQVLPHMDSPDLAQLVPCFHLVNMAPCINIPIIS